MTVTALGAAPHDTRATRLWRGTSARWLTFATLIGALIWVAPPPASVDPRGWHLLAVFVATVMAIVLRSSPVGGRGGILASPCQPRSGVDHYFSGLSADDPIITHAQ